MKIKSFILLLTSILLLPSCSHTNKDYNMKGQVNAVEFYAGNIMDDSGKNNHRIYKVKAFVTDDYYIGSVEATSLKLYDGKGKIINGNCQDTVVKLKKNNQYFIEIKANQPYQNFKIDLFPLNETIVTPYQMNFKEKKYKTNSTKSDPLKAAKLKYIQRKGGTYLYSNVPESMPYEVLNSIIMQNKDLSGECFLTFEHQNRTGINGIYMGYRITNTEDHDIYVTVTNVGYQTEGSWLGEKSWMDYYGVKYSVDTEHFKNAESWTWFNDYLHFDLEYQPTPIKPTTYKLPAGEHMYVIGGTTQDAYQHINVNHTADSPISTGKCINGNVKFTISNGKALGELCAYNNIQYINSGKATVQNLRRYGPNDDYGGRVGWSPIHGVIDSQMYWEINDKSYNQRLSVTYDSYYADQLKDSYEPFEPVTGCYNHTVENTKWFTHLSAQLNHYGFNKFIGQDMVDLHAICEGKEVLLSNYVANPLGNIWDFGNWMIEYQDTYTFVNRGNNERSVKIYLVNYSSIFYMIKDLNNQILKAEMSTFHCTGPLPIYELVLAPHSVQSICVQYVLPANTNGGMEHYVDLFGEYE